VELVVDHWILPQQEGVVQDGGEVAKWPFEGVLPEVIDDAEWDDVAVLFTYAFRQFI